MSFLIAYNAKNKYSMRDKLIDILWELDNHKYPNYEDKADEILSLFNVVGQSEQLKPLPPNECDMCGTLIDPRLTTCGGCGF
jgi:hypothetical protein